VAELLQLVPDFEMQGQETIRRIFRHDQPVELILDGLHKAGLDLLAQVAG
jgi:hypothetical protein